MRELFRTLEGVTYPTYFRLLDAIRDAFGVDDAPNNVPDAVDYARQRGWIKGGEEYGFIVRVER